MSCGNQSGGQVKKTLDIGKSFLRSTGDIGKDLSKGLSKTVGGVTNGLEIIANGAGNTLKNLSKNLGITSVKVVSRLGDFGLKASKSLGDVVSVVPILGKPAAYVIKGSGKGVYYVVTSVGDVLGKSVRSIGRVGKDVSDLVVFTIASTSGATQKTIDEAGKAVKKVADTLSGKNKSHKHHTKKHHSKTKKSRKTSKGGTYMSPSQQVESHDLSTMRNWQGLQGPMTRERSQQLEGNEWVVDTDGPKHISVFNEEQENRIPSQQLVKEGYVASNSRNLLSSQGGKRKTRKSRK